MKHTKKLMTYIVTFFIYMISFVFGVTTTIDFETLNDGYTVSATEGTGFTDVFNRTNPNIGGNSTYMWAAEDLSLSNPSITLNQISVTGATSFTFAIDLLAHHYNDWDNSDELLITYSVDGGGYSNLMWVQNTGETFNDPAALDTDFNGDGECANVLPALTTGTGTDNCVVSSSTFETFTTSSISLSSNSTLDITLQFNGLTSTDEGIYLDNITITTSSASVVDPTSLSASVQSASQIDLSWTDNANSDNVLLAWNSSSTFGTPTDGSTYTAGGSISGGGTVLQYSATDSYSHTSLTGNTAYYYKVWSYDGSAYSSGTSTNETTLKDEPTNHPTSLSATTSYQSIALSWTDAVTGSQAPDGYLILGETDATITDPTDGTAVSDDTDASDNTLAMSITHGSGASYTFSSLTASTTYYFEIFSYTNSGSSIDYKTDGTIVTANATTGTTPVFVINEILADPDGSTGDANGDGTVSTTNDEFVEIINNSGVTVDISNWVIADGYGDRHTIASGTSLLDQEALVVFGGGTPTNINGHVFTASTGSLGLNNGGDDVTLKDASGGTIVTYSYGSEANDNQSIARDSDLSGSFVKHSTISATGSANFSPGRKNSSIAAFQPLNLTISGNSGFRMMSSPVAGQIYSDLLSELWTQGMTSADVTGGDANVWTYDGSSWSALSDITGSGSGASLTAGQGFLVYVFADTDNDGTDDLPVTLSVSGTENSSSATVPSSGSIANGAWELAGNPYASTIDYDLVSRTNVTTSCYVYDDATDAYKSWNGSEGSLSNGLIAPYQGFWVQGNGESGSITIETSDKSSTAGTFYKTMNDSTGSFSISISSGDYSDQTYVSFMTNGEEGIDNSDAYKLLPMTPTERIVGVSYAESNGLDINNLPYNSENSINIPLDIMYLTVDDNYNFVTNEHDVTMSWDISSLPETIIGLTLTNNTTGETTNLLQTDEVSFTTVQKGSFPAYGSGGVNIYPEVGESQFTLTIHYSVLSSEDGSTIPTEYALHQAYPNPFNPSTTITFDVPAETGHALSLQIFNVKGQLVETLINEQMGPGTHKAEWNPSNVSSGLYIVQMKAGDKTFNQKITFIK